MTEQFRKSTLIIAPKRSGTNFTHDLLAPYHKSALNEPIGLHSELNYQNNGNPLSPWIFSSNEQVSEEFGHSGLVNDPYGSLLTRNFIGWLREGGKLIKETDFLYLGWLLESASFNVVSIERDPRESIASFKKNDFYNKWGYKERLTQFSQTIQDHPLLNTLYGDFLDKQSLTDLPWHRQLAFYYSVALLEIARNIKNQHALKVSYSDYINNPKNEFKKIFDFLNIEWDKKIEKEIFEKTTKSRNRQDPYTTYIKKEDITNFTEILSSKEAADIRHICSLFGINLEKPKTKFFESKSFPHQTTQKKDKIPIKKVERTSLVQEEYKSAKYIPYDKNGLYVAETLSTNSQFAQFLNWLIEQNFPTEINGRPLFYNDRPQSRIHIVNKIVSIEKGYEDHPATFVTWFGAAIFSLWLGGRLPTQKEWEKAIFTRSSELKSKQIIFSKDRENVAQYYGDTTPVRFFPSNKFGVYDEIGNTSIWLSNPDDDNPFEKLKAGLEWNHSGERGILPNPRPHWLGTSGLGIRVVFDEINKNQSDAEFSGELKNLVEFLTRKKHTNIEEANLELFRKIHVLFKKEII